MESSIIKEITYQQAVSFLLPKHYSGRKPNVTRAFGLFQNNALKAVCTFGKPASPNLCDTVCGKENAKYVIELNRLCRTEDFKEPLSHFVSVCLRLMSPSIIVSFSDTAMNHHGYVYQACNFIYTGCTHERTDKWTKDGKHSRHYKDSEQGEFRKVRSPKHRYVYFSFKGYRSLGKQWKESFSLKQEPYPKGDNSNYKLGTFLKDTLVRLEDGSRFESVSQDDCKAQPLKLFGLK